MAAATAAASLRASCCRLVAGSAPCSLRRRAGPHPVGAPREAPSVFAGARAGAGLQQCLARPLFCPFSHPERDRLEIIGGEETGKPRQIALLRRLVPCTGPLQGLGLAQATLSKGTGGPEVRRSVKVGRSPGPLACRLRHGWLLLHLGFSLCPVAKKSLCKKASAAKGISAKVACVATWRHRGDFPQLYLFIYLANKRNTPAPAQVCTACANAFAHGSNEVANSVGPLAAIYQIWQDSDVQKNAKVDTWLLAIGGVSITLGECGVNPPPHRHQCGHPDSVATVPPLGTPSGGPPPGSSSSPSRLHLSLPRHPHPLLPPPPLQAWPCMATK